MASCLGLFIDENVIKYAKVAKDHDVFKVESYGVKFSDNINDSIKQIVNETYSYKIPISTNLSDEHYTYSELFSLLNQKDLSKAAKTEFEYFCNETHKNINGIEYRNIIVPSIQEKDKVKSIYAYTDKSEIAGKLQTLSGYKVTNLSPLPITISNLLKYDKRTKVIVNIENKTTFTFIVNGKIQKVEKIDIGMSDILNNIIAKENSYMKAYEICKNTTIYTTQGRNLQIEENEYIEDIIPTLYKIVEELTSKISSNQIDIDDIYITGLVTSINNVDLYFQENFPNKKCEIITPFFIQKSNIKLNIKDYIEVNSAIALGLEGLGIGEKSINFKKVTLQEKIGQILNIEIGKKSEKTSKKSANLNKIIENIKLDFKKSLDTFEKNMIRFAVGILILLIIYVAFTGIIMNRVNKKQTEVSSFIASTRNDIATITNNTKRINEKRDSYDELIQKINEESDKLSESYAKKNVLPNFLTEIMFNIPKEVQLLSIKNETGKEIKIEAQSKEYEQLGYFIAKIKNEAILTDVTSTSGQRQGEFILVTIEGNLPY